METDCYFPAGVPLSQAGNAARQAAEAGSGAVWLTETRHHPFLASAAALAVTKGMRVEKLRFSGDFYWFSLLTEMLTGVARTIVPDC